MKAFQVRGGRPLGGAVRILGAKNGVLPMMAAAILAGGVSVIDNCPQIRDVGMMMKILEHLGCRAKLASGTLEIDAASLTRSEIPAELMREMRSSVIFLGPLLARCESCVISLPGGCELGPRPIDLHVRALQQMGAVIENDRGLLRCSCQRLHGADIVLPFPSVGATENILLAAVTADGVTRITNAAREPEIEALASMLAAMGAHVGITGSSILVEGVERRSLNGVRRPVLPDRIESATFLLAAAAAGGSITLLNTAPRHLSAVLSVLAETGCGLRVQHDAVELQSRGRPAAAQLISTQPYPGFPTDAQAPMMALMCTAAGTSVFSENIFQSRYSHVQELCRMGAKIRTDGRTAVVEGVPRLTGAETTASDLRAGAALVIAALAADGESRIGGAELIERGYERLDERLRLLGADIGPAE